MSSAFPIPWTFSAEDEFEDSPIRAANGERVLVRDNGVYPPDLETCREIVNAVNDIGRLREAMHRTMGFAYRERQKADEFWRLWKEATGSEFAKKLSTTRTERDRLRDIVRRLLVAIDAMNALIVRLNPHMMPVDIQPGATCLGVDVGDAVREAREALGEGKE